jgi:hypothetical protein
MRTPLLLLLCLGACTEKSASPATPAPVTAKVVEDAGPAIELEDDDLLIDSKRATSGDSVSFELTLDEGHAFLVLDGRGGGRIGARDSTAGAKFLEGAAKWLKLPVPDQTHVTPLRALTFEVINMGDQDESGQPWQMNKVFFTAGGEYAELYINVAADGRHVIFRPKDSGYAEPVLEFLTDALRDGPPPPRTIENDSNLDSPAPLFKLRKDRDNTLTSVACLGSGWLGLRGEESEEVLHTAWNKEGAASWCELPGGVTTLAANGANSTVVAMVREPAHAATVVRRDEVIWPWVLEGGKCRRMPPPKGKQDASQRTSEYDRPLISPNGKELALKEGESLRFVNLATGVTRVVALPKETFLTDYAWTPDGVVLTKLGEGFVLVTTGPKSAVTSLEDPTLISLDGRQRATFGKTLEVRLGGGEPRTFAAKLRADRRALVRARDNAPMLLGPHEVVLDGNPQLVLDLDTLKTRLLVLTGERLLCSSPDGKHGVFWDERSRSYLAGDRE